MNISIYIYIYEYIYIHIDIYIYIYQSLPEVLMVPWAPRSTPRSCSSCVSAWPRRAANWTRSCRKRGRTWRGRRRCGRQKEMTGDAIDVPEKDDLQWADLRENL